MKFYVIGKSMEGVYVELLPNKKTGNGAQISLLAPDARNPTYATTNFF